MKKSFIPNLFTFINLGCGVISIIMIFHNNYKWACLFILMAALVDRYDGRVARFLNVSSDLGKELDSLADLVSFGVAPALLIYTMYNFMKLGILGYILVLLFPISGAYRLARYNSVDFSGVFTGIPITVAGSVMALISLLTLKNNANILLPILLMIILSYLMISKLKFKKL